MSDTGFHSPCLLVSRVRIVCDPQRFGPPPRQFAASACVTALRAPSNSTGCHGGKCRELPEEMDAARVGAGPGNEKGEQTARPMLGGARVSVHDPRVPASPRVSRRSGLCGGRGGTPRPPSLRDRPHPPSPSSAARSCAWRRDRTLAPSLRPLRDRVSRLVAE